MGRGVSNLECVSTQNSWSALNDSQWGSLDFWSSIGLRVNADGGVTDLATNGPADKAGLGPGMRLVAVNGRAFTPALLRVAVHDAGENGPALELIVENSGFYKVIPIDYHGGERS